MSKSDATDKFRQAQNRKLFCEICYEKFDFNERLAMSLPCFHNICASCLSRKTSNKCFFCRKEFQNEPQKNENILNFLKILEEYEPKKKKSEFEWEEYRYCEEGKYTGLFLNGYYHGYGKMTYHNGDVYEGEWKKGLRHGIGIFYEKNGPVKNGVWKEDIFKESNKIA